MTDDMKQPRDETGQFVSIGTLFERERLDHAAEHREEHIVAAETARRLEEKVNEAATRLEREVQTALVAVAETARIHAEAHAREHTNHERIHKVENDQVEEAKRVMNLRLDAMNEFRSALADQSNKAVTRDIFDQRAESVDSRLGRIESNLIGREAFSREINQLDEKIDILNTWKSKATGAAIILTLVAGVIGAAILKVFGG